MAVGSRSYVPVIPRVLVGAVAGTAYMIVLIQGPPTLPRMAAAAGGAFVGLASALWAWSLMVLLLGPWCGLMARIVLIGAGPALRTSIGTGRIVVVRRVPVPVVDVLPGVGPGPVVRWKVVVGAIVALAVQVLAGWALLQMGPAFGTVAGVTCMGAAVIRLGATVHASVRVGTAGAGAGDAAVTRVMAAVQKDVAEARRLIGTWSDQALLESVGGRTAELLVLVGEGRYRETVALAELLARDPGLPAEQRASIELTCARALVYAMEREDPEPGARERFLALYGRLRRAPAPLTSGSDLKALHHLVEGDVGRAVDEARSAARVGSAPLRRSMTYCTLALALDRVGRAAEARKALAAARSVGPHSARIDFVARRLAEGGQGGQGTQRTQDVRTG
ncbi:hypothetical protein [Kitasatospora sp. NBC_01539]|uniref:hypothetical protein n=1 Tax=Kitasatospora sp. NBC_01539 TaxID=2903577 RepID=UPI00386030E8